MIYAIVKDGVIEKHGFLMNLFPEVSFPVMGPNSEWMLENNVREVVREIDYDPASQVVENVEPYFVGDVVYCVRAVDRDPVDVQNERNNAIYNAIQESDAVFLAAITEDEKIQFFDAQAHKIRSLRDKKLQSSDWTQGKDISDAVSNPWAAYRDELRNVPQQAGFPWDVVWPTPPDQEQAAA